MPNVNRDLIRLACPACGANLNVNGSATNLKCGHCQTEYRVRQDARGVTLEEYARCPVCNRNDESKKVTAILRTHTRNSQGVTYQTRTVLKQVGENTVPVEEQVAVPIQTSQTSELAQHLLPPERPEVRTDFDVPENTSHVALRTATATGGIGLLLVLCTISFTVFSVFGSNSSSQNGPNNVLMFLFCCAGSLIPLGGSIALFIYAVPDENRTNQLRINKAAREKQRLQYQASDGLRQWERAMDRWNKLYYCGRDDCVFVLGSNTSAPVEEMMDYLYQS